jgi:cytochrome c1
MHRLPHCLAGPTLQADYAGPPYPPDFKDIANRSNVTAAALQHHLETLPAVPQNSRMPNQILSAQELRNVVAFILSLRDKQKAPQH